MKKLSLTIAAAALAVSVSGAAFADEVENAASKQFAVLEGIAAQPLTAGDMAIVRGQGSVIVFVNPNSPGFSLPDRFMPGPTPARDDLGIPAGTNVIITQHDTHSSVDIVIPTPANIAAF